MEPSLENNCCIQIVGEWWRDKCWPYKSIIKIICRFYDDEADGRPFYHRIPESVPVDCPLVPAYVDAVDGISGRIIRVSVNSTPSEAGGCDKKEIKKEAIQYSKTCHSNPSHPAWNVVPGFYDWMKHLRTSHLLAVVKLNLNYCLTSVKIESLMFFSS